MQIRLPPELATMVCLTLTFSVLASFIPITNGLISGMVSIAKGALWGGVVIPMLDPLPLSGLGTGKSLPKGELLAELIINIKVSITYCFCFRGVLYNNFAWTTSKGKFVRSREDIKLPSSQWQWVSCAARVFSIHWLFHFVSFVCDMHCTRLQNGGTLCRKTWLV